MIDLLITLIQAIGSVLFILVIVSVVLSYFMSPYHPIRANLDRIVEPLLSPIRRVVPPVGMIDFSPLILIILIQVVETLLISLLASLR
ncbi:MAG: YggT family protein [Chloroflexota bacterium]|nr:MAG: YggT family protein [Bellilinea sp.]